MDEQLIAAACKESILKQLQTRGMVYYCYNTSYVSNLAMIGIVNELKNLQFQTSQGVIKPLITHNYDENHGTIYVRLKENE